MANKANLMACGMAWPLAAQIGFDDAATGLSGAGTTATDATVLTSNFSLFSTVDSGTGALLPGASGQAPYAVYNGGSNALLVYPAGTETINGAASFSVTNGKAAIFFPNGSRWIAILSA